LLLKALRAHADLAHKIELLVSIEGIGERTALALVVRMPELLPLRERRRTRATA
jgi:transposase